MVREELKTIEGWHKSECNSWDEYCKPGDMVDQGVADYFLDYKKYDKILEELRPVKWFLNWCGDRYKDKSVSKYRFRIITKAKQFFLYKDIYFARDKEIEIPKDLQKRIVEVIEDWVDEKEQELKNI